MSTHSEALENAREELKRADHLLFVSLKYTRTVDIIKHIIERLLNCYTNTFLALLEHLKEQKKITDMPVAPVKKAELLRLIYAADPRITETVEFYLLLRKVDRAEFTRAREYRRHVTMTTVVDEMSINIDIDKVHEYYDKTREFVSYAQDLIAGRNNQES